MRKALLAVTIAVALTAPLWTAPLLALVESDRGEQEAPGALKVFHEPVTSAPAGQEVPLAACISGGDKETKVFLCYRPRGGSFYETAEMLPDARGCYEASIPGPFAVRGVLEYYIKADPGSGRPPTYEGGPREPLRIEVLGKARPRSQNPPQKERPAEASGGGGYIWRTLVLVFIGLAVLGYALRHTLRRRSPFPY